MENKKYVCIKDYQNSDFMLGQAKTLEQWKKWVIEEQVKSLYSISLLFDESAIERLHTVVGLKEDGIVNYINNVYDLELIPLENSEYKYIDMDNHKLLTDADLKEIALNLEHGDLLDNVKDYSCGELSVDTWCENIKKALSGDVEWLLNELDLFGYYIVKIQ